ncbi:hypothetical protein [Streptomyces sp. NPDC126514]|uniref:hypothetical protein n=1 Tax=Streptomyces sp. NPDC126514 TaxID=3155210 RepID=UPI0033186FF9
MSERVRALVCRGAAGSRWWRSGRRLDGGQERLSGAQPGDGFPFAVAGERAVVAREGESYAGGAEWLYGDQSVAERVGELLDPALLRDRAPARRHLDTAAAVEARPYAVLVHVSHPPPGFNWWAAQGPPILSRTRADRPRGCLQLPSWSRA